MASSASTTAKVLSLMNDSRKAPRSINGEGDRAHSEVQVGKHRSERFASVQLLCRLRILRVHVHDEVRVFGEQSHLTRRVAPIRAMWVRFDQLSDGEAIGGFSREMVTCLLMRGAP